MITLNYLSNVAMTSEETLPRELKKVKLGYEHFLPVWTYSKLYVGQCEHFLSPAVAICAMPDVAAEVLHRVKCLIGLHCRLVGK